MEQQTVIARFIDDHTSQIFKDIKEAEEAVKRDREKASTILLEGLEAITRALRQLL